MIYREKEKEKEREREREKRGAKKQRLGEREK